MKKIYAAVILFFLCSSTQAKLNNFGISTIIPEEQTLLTEKNMTQEEERIHEEFPHGLTLHEILKFAEKIQKYLDHLLYTHNKDTQAWQIAQLALGDIHKAKKRLKSNRVHAAGEHKLRVMLGKLDRQINLPNKNSYPNN